MFQTKVIMTQESEYSIVSAHGAAPAKTGK